jgi:molecular chaperone GrpE
MAEDAPQPEAPEAEAMDNDAGLAALAAAQGEIAALKDALLRAMAETENTRRRAERQAAEARVYAIDRFARDLLAVADNLGRALESTPPDVPGPVHTFIEGVAMTEKSLLEAFSRHGLTRTGAKGELFDANLHQAVAQVPSDAPAGAVAEVFQPGYTLGDRTLRPAMVAVSAGAPANDPPAPPAAEEPPREGKIDIKI